MCPWMPLSYYRIPFEQGKYQQRIEQLSCLAKQLNADVISVNQVGAYADILFDGQSLVMNAQGEVIAQAPSFQEVALPMSMLQPQ